MHCSFHDYLIVIELSVKVSVLISCDLIEIQIIEGREHISFAVKSHLYRSLAVGGVTSWNCLDIYFEELSQIRLIGYGTCRLIYRHRLQK